MAPSFRQGTLLVPNAAAYRTGRKRLSSRRYREYPAELSRLSVQHLPIVHSTNLLAFLLIPTTASGILPMCLPIYGQSASL